MEKIKELIKKDDYLLFHEEKYNFITIFCNKEYDYNDYDIISKVQRDYLKKVINDLGYFWKTGSILESKKDNPPIIFPKYKVRNFFPKEDVLTATPEGIYVITPTQLAYFYLRETIYPKEKLIDLIYSQPINIDKLIRFFPLLKENLIQLQEEQNYALKVSALRHKNQIDSTF